MQCFLTVFSEMKEFNCFIVNNTIEGKTSNLFHLTLLQLTFLSVRSQNSIIPI